MKKPTQKLTLNRETVRSLSESELRRVQGAYYTGPQPTQVCTNPYVDKDCSGWTLDCWSGAGNCL
jgi:hypothetical protein